MVSRVADEWVREGRIEGRVREGERSALERSERGRSEEGEVEKKGGGMKVRDDSGGGWKVRIKIQISQPGKSPHFEVRRAQWANMNTLQRVCIQPRAGNAFY